MASVTILGTPTIPSGSVPSGAAAWTWNLSAALGAKTFWDPLETTAGFVIPAGVSAVEVFVSLKLAFSSASADCQVAIRKNGTAFYTANYDDQGAEWAAGFSTGIVQVAEGDIIDMVWTTFGSGTQTVNASRSFFSITEIGRTAIASGSLLSTTAILTTPTLMQWSVDVDTHESYAGSGEFIVPPGCDVAIVSANVVPASFSTGTITYRLYVNGTEVRLYQTRFQNWLTGPSCFGPVEVAEGDVLTVAVSSSSSTSASTTRGCRVSVEFIEAA